MSRTKLAPDLIAFLDAFAARTVAVSNATPKQLRDQGRALLAVASAAGPMLRSRDHFTWAKMRRALARLKRLSSPPSRRTARGTKEKR